MIIIISGGIELLFSANLGKIIWTICIQWHGYKHCNFITKIDSSPSANRETPQKFLQWLAIVLSLKAWKQIFKKATMALKETINVFYRNFKEFNVLFDQALQKSTFMLKNVKPSPHGSISNWRR